MLPAPVALGSRSAQFWFCQRTECCVSAHHLQGSDIHRQTLTQRLSFFNEKVSKMTIYHMSTQTGDNLSP